MSPGCFWCGMMAELTERKLYLTSSSQQCPCPLSWNGSDLIGKGIAQCLYASGTQASHLLLHSEICRIRETQQRTIPNFVCSAQSALRFRKSVWSRDQHGAGLASPNAQSEVCLFSLLVTLFDSAQAKAQCCSRYRE